MNTGTQLATAMRKLHVTLGRAGQIEQYAFYILLECNANSLSKMASKDISKFIDLALCKNICHLFGLP